MRNFLFLTFIFLMNLMFCKAQNTTIIHRNIRDLTNSLFIGENKQIDEITEFKCVYNQLSTSINSTTNDTIFLLLSQSTSSYDGAISCRTIMWNSIDTVVYAYGVLLEDTVSDYLYFYEELYTYYVMRLVANLDTLEIRKKEDLHARECVSLGSKKHLAARIVYNSNYSFMSIFWFNDFECITDLNFLEKFYDPRRRRLS